MWCKKCLSLQILIFDGGNKDIVEKYCGKCLCTDLDVGHIFYWLEIQPKRTYKNLREYQEYTNTVDYADYKDSIAQEIEEEINSLYVNDFLNIN